VEFIESIKNDVKWLGFEWDGIWHVQYANSHLVQAESVFELYYVDQNLGLR
jgi:glutamyl/glutaminyl-tRNA synthetase